MKTHRFWTTGFVIFAAAIGATATIGIGRQLAQAGLLETQLRIAQLETADLATLRAEKQRLLAQQISAAELQRLRDDHAALARLRAELETIKAGSGSRLH